MSRLCPYCNRAPPYTRRAKLGDEMVCGRCGRPMDDEP